MSLSSSSLGEETEQTKTGYQNPLIEKNSQDWGVDEIGLQENLVSQRLQKYLQTHTLLTTPITRITKQWQNIWSLFLVNQPGGQRETGYT